MLLQMNLSNIGDTVIPIDLATDVVQLHKYLLRMSLIWYQILCRL